MSDKSFVITFSLFFCILICISAKCPPLPMLEHGNYVKTRGKVRVNCHPSYEYENPFFIGEEVRVITCRKGRWDDPHPKCTKIPQTCLPPKDIEHGQIVRGVPPYEPGSEVVYLCNNGYNLLGAEKIVCQHSQYEWSDQPPVCEKKLPPLVVMKENMDKHLVKELAQYDAGRVIGHDVEFLGLDLFLVFDKSNSIFPTKFTEGIKFAKFLIEQFNISNGDSNKVGGTRLAVFTFGDDCKEEISLEDGKISSTKIAVEKLDTIKCVGHCDGATNMAAALSRIDFLSKKTRKDAKKVIFITSDGDPTPDPKVKPVQYYIEKLKNTGFEIYTVGIGQDVNEKLLKEMASSPINEHMFLLDEFENLGEVMDLIRNGTTEPPPPAPEKCGYLSERGYKTKRLQNGEVKIRHWPWLAAVVVNDQETGTRFACSGVVICQNWVLTTAQCVTDDKNEAYLPENVYIVLGDEDFEKEDPNEQLFYAMDIKIHQSFVKNRTKIRNDIALIKLNDQAKITDFTRIACILEDGEDYSTKPGETVYMVGWLVTKEEVVRLPEEPVKEFKAQQVKLEINAINTCEVNRPAQYECSSNILTANAGDQPSKSCSAVDIGSPLFMLDSSGKKMNVVGVASYVEGCTLKSKLAFFTRISSYNDWIQEKIGFCNEDYE